MKSSSVLTIALILFALSQIWKGHQDSKYRKIEMEVWKHRLQSDSFKMEMDFRMLEWERMAYKRADTTGVTKGLRFDTTGIQAVRDTWHK